MKVTFLFLQITHDTCGHDTSLIQWFLVAFVLTFYEGFIETGYSYWIQGNKEQLSKQLTCFSNYLFCWQKSHESDLKWLFRTSFLSVYRKVTVTLVLKWFVLMKPWQHAPAGNRFMTDGLLAHLDGYTRHRLVLLANQRSVPVFSFDVPPLIWQLERETSDGNVSGSFKDAVGLPSQ